MVIPGLRPRGSIEPLRRAPWVLRPCCREATTCNGEREMELARPEHEWLHILLRCHDTGGPQAPPPLPERAVRRSPPALDFPGLCPHAKSFPERVVGHSLEEWSAVRWDRPRPGAHYTEWCSARWRPGPRRAVRQCPRCHTPGASRSEAGPCARPTGRICNKRVVRSFTVTSKVTPSGARSGSHMFWRTTCPMLAGCDSLPFLFEPPRLLAKSMNCAVFVLAKPFALPPDTMSEKCAVPEARTSVCLIVATFPHSCESFPSAVVTSTHFVPDIRRFPMTLHRPHLPDSAAHRTCTGGAATPFGLRDGDAPGAAGPTANSSSAYLVSRKLPPALGGAKFFG